MELKVLSNLDHNGNLYVAGDKLTLEDEKQVQVLIDAGVVEKTASLKKEAVKTGEVEDGKPKKSLGKMNKAELEEVALEEDVELTEDMTNDDRVAAIKAARGE